jgi:hypothetical protein
MPKFIGLTPILAWQIWEPTNQALVDGLEKENEKDEESERSTVGENRRAIGPIPHVRY